MSIPGFKADAALYETHAPYIAVDVKRNLSRDRSVVAQMRTSNVREAGGPFSGSCGCGPGFCCCELCYFKNCSWWCWMTGPIVGRF